MPIDPNINIFYEYKGLEEENNSKRKRCRHSKSRNGCSNCKRLRVKCDEGKPRCSNCQRRKRECVYLQPSATNPGGRAPEATQSQENADKLSEVPLQPKPDALMLKFSALAKPSTSALPSSLDPLSAPSSTSSSISEISSPFPNASFPSGTNLPLALQYSGAPSSPAMHDFAQSQAQAQTLAQTQRQAQSQAQTQGQAEAQDSIIYCSAPEAFHRSLQSDRDISSESPATSSSSVGSFSRVVYKGPAHYMSDTLEAADGVILDFPKVADPEVIPEFVEPTYEDQSLVPATYVTPFSAFNLLQEGIAPEGMVSDITEFSEGTEAYEDITKESSSDELSVYNNAKWLSGSEGLNVQQRLAGSDWYNMNTLLRKSENPSYNPSSMPGIFFPELELMNFFVLHTSKIIMNDLESERLFWKHKVPQFAFSSKFLMDSILGISALYLTHRSAGKRNLIPYARKKFYEVIEQFNDLGSIPLNCLFHASGILMEMGFSFVDKIPLAEDGGLDLIRLINEPLSFASAARDLSNGESNGSFNPIIYRDFNIKVGPTCNSSNPVVRSLYRLCEIMAERGMFLPERFQLRPVMRGGIIRPYSGPYYIQSYERYKSITDIYFTALGILDQCIDGIIKGKSEEHSIVLFYLLPPDFLNMVKRHYAIASTMLSCMLLCLTVGNSHFWYRDRAVYEFDTLAQQLGSSWQGLFDWVIMNVKKANIEGSFEGCHELLHPESIVDSILADETNPVFITPEEIIFFSTSY